MHIYIITNQVNGKKYVGQTVSYPPSKRWKYHLARARQKPLQNDMILYLAIRKHGPDNFTIEYYKLHDGASQNLLNQIECLAIVKYNSIAPNGYNTKEGGSRGKHSEESKLKMSNAKFGIPTGPRSMPRSKAHRLALGNGIKNSIKHKRHSADMKGIPQGPLSQAHKDAISTGLTGYKRPFRSHGPMSQSHKDAVSAGLRRFYAK